MGVKMVAGSPPSTTMPPRNLLKIPTSKNDLSKDMYGTVPLVKRVTSWIERTDAGMELDILSAVLSVATVVTYMTETYYPEDSSVYISLKGFDLAASILFALEWSFWLWLSRNKVRYALSIQSLVDIVTVVPIFISFFISEQVPGFATFEAMIRILRVLRVFRVFRLGRRLRNEVQARLLTLIFTLLAIIVTSAGLFYEIETRYGERYPDLTMMRAIYWSVVTTTTIGYGDITPTLVGSQLTLIAMLFITFAILPYQTSALATALSYTSVYTTAHYSRRSRGRHIVVMGHLTVPTMLLLADELYPEDYGFQDFSCVFLNPQDPCEEMRRVLKTHKQAHRMMYLQGSSMSHEDLARAQVDKADAVLVMCNKTPEDAREEDLGNIMSCLAVGQYTQMVNQASNQSSIPTISQQLVEFCNACFSRLHKAKKQPMDLPYMCLQLLLPESQQRLMALLETYTVHTSSTADPAVQELQGAELTAGDGSTAGCQQFTGTVSHSANHSEPLLRQGSSSSTCQPPASAVSMFWQRFKYSLNVICITEMKYSLLGQSLLACPGAATLLCNLVRSVDSSALMQAGVEHLPQWFQEYLDGSGNELYEVASFPPHMLGEPVAAVTLYLQETHRAIIVATAGSCHESSGLQEVSHSKASPAAQDLGTTAATTPEGKAQRMLSAVVARKLSSLSEEIAFSNSTISVPLHLAPLQHIITSSTSAFVIASDLRVVLDIMEGSEEDYLQWRSRQPEWQADRWTLQQPDCYLEQLSSKAMKANIAQQTQYSVDRVKQSAELQEPAGSCASCQVMQQQPAAGCLQPVAQLNSDLHLPVVSANGLQAHDRPAEEHNSPTKQSSSRRRRTTTGSMVSNAEEQENEQQRITVDSVGATSSSRCEGSNAAGTPLGSARGYMGSIVSGHPSSDTASSQSGMFGKRRRRASIQVNTRPAIALRQFTDNVSAASSHHQTSTRRQLSAASRKGSAMAARKLQRLYHTRQLEKTGSTTQQEMLKDEVTVQGHLLVCACCTPPSALFCLLAPIRSSSLASVQPVVILDTKLPTGPEWSTIASLTEVYYVQGSMHDPDALLRANAEAAASAVVLMPWANHNHHTDQHQELIDAHTLAAIRSLKALNPAMKVFYELQSLHSMAFADPIGSLLDWRAGKATAAAATPAYMSGSVLWPDMVDTIVCQAMHNHNTPRIITQLLSHWHTQYDSRSHAAVPSGTQRKGGDSSVQQGGTKVSEGVVDEVACANPADVRGHPGDAALGSQVADSPPAGNVTTSGRGQFTREAVLLQLKVAGSLCDTFGELFGLLLIENGMICCGLYRAAEHEGRQVWHVVTNPCKDLLLRDDDYAFVLMPHKSGAVNSLLRPLD